MFFEALVKQTSLYGIKAPQKIAHLYRLNKTRLTEKITDLSANYTEHFESIRHWKQSSALCPTQRSVTDFKIFEILNAEKSNPHFLT